MADRTFLVFVDLGLRNKTPVFMQNSSHSAFGEDLVVMIPDALDLEPGVQLPFSSRALPPSLPI